MTLQWVIWRGDSGVGYVLSPHKKSPQLRTAINSVRLIVWNTCHALLRLTAKGWHAQYHVYAAEHLRVQGK